jgi:hypothetical protein
MQLRASSTSTRWQTLVPTVIAIAAAIALVVVLALRGVSALRRRTRSAG